MNKDYSNSIKLFSYPKCTTSLKVLGKRSDGFHEIDAEVKLVDAPKDEIVLSDFVFDLQNIFINSNSSLLPTDETNFISIALKLIDIFIKDKKINLALPSKIYVNKKIPICGGLGGGSSNAAAIICWARNEIIQLGYDIEIANDFVLEIAPKVSSDVLACCYYESRMLGRGDKVVAKSDYLDPLKNLDGLKESAKLVIPPFGCSTPLVYKRWSQMFEENFNFSKFNNYLEPAARNVYKELDDLFLLFNNLDVEIELLGSGSTCIIYKEFSKEQYKLIPQNIKIIETKFI